MFNSVSSWPLRACAVAALALLCSGCGTFRSYDKELRGTLAEVSSGNVDGAIKTLESNNRSDKKDLLYYFELGELERLKDRYQDSQKSWMSADQRVHSWEAAAKADPSRLLGSASSLLLNDKSRPYEGHDYEKVMLTTRMALNFLAMSDYQNARVAITQTHEREAVIADLRAKEISEVERDAGKRGAPTSFKELNGYPVQTIDNPQVNALKNSYQSALSHYLAGFIYESLGEPSLAAAGYRQAIELQPNRPVLEEGLAGLDRRVAEPKDGLTDVLFVVETGTAPARESREFPLPIPVNRTLILIPISFPVMQTTSNPPSPAQLQIDAGQSLSVVPITSIDLMARRALKDEMPGLMLRGAIRSGAKAVAQYSLQHQARQQENALLGLAALAMTIGSYVTESADERTWRTLPAEIAIARGRVPPGSHSITLQTGAGPRTVQINVSGRYAVVGLRLLRNQLFLQALVPGAASAAPSAPQPPSTPGPPATLEEPIPATEAPR
jgi:uncharacterized protein